MLKNQKGVTLIALVITIIVLLILAGITITLALDPDGIVNRSREAKNEWEHAEQNEMTGMNNILDIWTEVQQNITGEE